MKEIISRVEAKARGMTRYFSGEPCSKGHVADRRVSDRHCVECRKTNKANYYKNNKDKILQRQAVYRAKNSDRDRKRSIQYYYANIERMREYGARYRASNLEKSRAYQVRWRKENPEKHAAKESKRRARKINATTTWDVEFTDFVTKQAYDLAQRREASTGFAWHVDHMIPLQARVACGLHTWSNIQVIPERLNLAKRNRMIMIEAGDWILHV